MPPRRRGRYRQALLLAASLTLAAAAAPVASAATVGGVRVTVNGHSGPRLALALLADHVDVPLGTPTTTRHPDGSETTDPHGGTSARLLVTLAGLDPAHVTGMQIERPTTTGAVALTGAEVRDGFGGDPLGLRQATFDPAYNATEVHFFRPLRDAGDVNALDALDPPLESDLLVAVTTDGGVLSVSARADPAQTDAGAPVHFSATVAGAPPDATFVWDFGDGADATSAASAVDHVYATDGSYDATVTAITPAGDSGAAVVRVLVGTLAGAGGGTTGGGGTTTQAGGGTGGRAAPSTGRVRGGVRASAERRAASKSDDARVQDNHASVPRASSGSGALAVPTTRSSTTTAAPMQTARRAAAGARRARRISHPARTAAGRVSGVLLASSGDPASVLAGLSRPPVAHRDATARATASHHGGSVRWWLLGGLALGALLGLGAAREAGLRAPRWRRRAVAA